ARKDMERRAAREPCRTLPRAEDGEGRGAPAGPGAPVPYAREYERVFVRALAKASSPGCSPRTEGMAKSFLAAAVTSRQGLARADASDLATCQLRHCFSKAVPACVGGSQAFNRSGRRPRW